MKLHLFRASACLAALILFAPLCPAQKIVIPKPDPVALERAAVQRNAIELAAKGDFDAAEQRLFTLINRPGGTAAWHLDAGTLLSYIAVLARMERRSPELVRSLGQRSLVQLEQADKLSKPEDGIVAVRIKLRMGDVNENLGGSREKAREAYEGAARLAPNSKDAAAGVSRTAKTSSIRKEEDAK